MNVVILGDSPFLEELMALSQRSGCGVTAIAADSILAKLDDLESAAALPAADVVIEVCHRGKAARRRLINLIDSVYGSETLLLASALTSSATEIASWTKTPGRVVGFAVLPPLAEMGMAEIAAGLNTDPSALQRAADFWQEIGYEPAVVADGPGLVRGRLIACIINEAAGALQDRVATAADIDTAMQLGTNYPHGPLAWADHLGLDVVLGIMTGLYEEWGEDRYRPAPLLRRMVLAGQLGKKTGCGFYQWHEMDA